LGFEGHPFGRRQFELAFGDHLAGAFADSHVPRVYSRASPQSV
jgi:hypothetical protein